jgi:zinc protease
MGISMRHHRNVKRIWQTVLWLVLALMTLSIVLWSRTPALADIVAERTQEARPYNQLELPPLPEIKIPEYERYQLKNGLVVYLVEDHSLPLIGGSAILRTGARFESPDKIGLAGIVGTVMRSGGTKKHPADVLNQNLEQIAASVETGIDDTSGSASFNCLTENIEEVLGLFAEVVQEPAFTVDKLELAKNQTKSSIARRNDNPSDITNREFDKLIYGKDSPYARTVEYQTIDNITREDVVNFYQRYVRPEQIILGVVGDFEPTKMKESIERYFGNWQVTTAKPNLKLPATDRTQSGGVFLVEQSQLTQSNVLLGHLGGKLDSPDYPALSVLNEVLNGFGGRLFNEVRSRQGLAYSVYGYWSPRYDYPGVFLAGGQTRSETTVAFVQSILAEIEKIRDTPISQPELSKAKESILNSFVFNFENPSQTMSRLMRYEYFGYPKDFIFQYQEAAKKTTAEDIQRVAQTYLQPDKIVTLVVGNSQQIQPPLTALSAKVQAVDVSIPQ